MNRLTAHKRGPVPLTADERKRARFLRVDLNWDWPAIAADVGRSESDIRHSLATVRTRTAAPKRGTVNVSPALLDHLRSLQLPDEAMWETMNRLFGI